jgi:hypothetical protein
VAGESTASRADEFPLASCARDPEGFAASNKK